MSFYNRIVQINVTETIAPQPNALQQTAAIVSQNNTIFAPGSINYIASPTDLAASIESATPIQTIAWSAGVVTVNFTAGHGVTVGDTTPLLISDCVPDGYNGNFVATASNSTSLTYSLANDPGTETTLGNAYFGTSAWLIAADRTWWAQGNLLIGYYVFESGHDSAASVLTAVGTYIAANPFTVYNWGFLPGIDEDPTNAITFFNQHNALNSLIKFYLPISLNTYYSWQNQQTLKNVAAFVQTPNYMVGYELDSIAMMQYITAFVPSPTNKLPPSQYTYLLDVTAFTSITQAQITEFAASNVNWISTGAEGGISNTMLINGKEFNGHPINVAYSIDWVQIQENEALANAVINGSNNPQAPLYYNQDGINFLQQVAAQVANRAIQCGLALGRVILTQLPADQFALNLQNGLYNGNFVINAVPFNSYVASNPSDYANQKYGGFGVAYTPQYGFETIVFNIDVVQFA